jgi:hypothetical protein
MPQGRESDPAVERWAGAGHSDDSDSARAGLEAVAAAITGEDPRLVLVFASSRHDFDALAHAAQEAAGPAALVGCSGGTGVTAFALGGRGLSAATACAPMDGSGSRAAGESAARCLSEIDGRLPHRALILLADGLSGDPQDVVRGVYSVAGATVALAGGCAGAQVHGDQAMRGSVVAAALASDAPFGVGVRHGWRPRADPLLITASDGTRVRAINDRPALDVYLELSADGAQADFSRYSALHPFGVAAARGREAQIRAVVDADFEARWLQCNGELAAGSLVWPMEGASDEVLNATSRACVEALLPLRAEPPLGLLAFDSVARAALLGSEGMSEARARIAAAAAGAPVGGFGSSGEIARTSGSVGFHSHALAVLAIG